MANHQIKYTVDNVQALAGINQMVTALRRLDAICDRVKPKIQSIAKGASRPMNAFWTSVGKVTTHLGQMSAAATSAGTSLGTLGSAASAARNQLSLGTASLGAFSTAALGLAAAGAAVQTMNKAFEDARKFAQECADEAFRLRDAVRELTATKGGNTTIDSSAESIKDLMVKTTATQEEANTFATSFESTVPAARKKGNWGLNDEQTEDLKAEALKLGVKKDIDPRVMGEMTAMIGIGEQVTSVKQAMGKLAVMTSLFAEGVGPISELGKVYERLRGDMVREEGGGLFRNSMELAALVSTDSTDSGNPAAVTNKARIVAKELSFAKENNKEKQALLDSFNIPAGADYTSHVQPFAAWVKKIEADPKKDIYKEMERAGFTRAESFGPLLQAAHEFPLLEKNMALAGRDPLQKPITAATRAQELAALEAKGAEEIKANDAFIRDNPHRVAEAKLNKARLDRGAEEADLATMRKMAEGKLVREHKVDTPWANLWEGAMDMGGLSMMLGNQPARVNMQDDVIVDSLQRLAPKTVEQFPELNLGLQMGTGGPTRITTDQLKAIFKAMPADEKQAVFADIGAEQGNGLKAQRNLGGPDDGVPPVPQAAAKAIAVGGDGGMPGGGLGGGAILSVLSTIAAETKKTNDLIAQNKAKFPNGGGAVFPGRK